MYSRKTFEEIEQKETEVWSCTSPECNGWMRQDFSFTDIPACPLCQNTMEKEARMLPVVENLSNKMVRS
ncbi:cold-shock protein [Paenibacillus sp. J2TS4]|uniref:cold-shock protein n=1 Tax=Paenibacillus sp. J2TS4 TaxID=2807194 RepID=UPI001B0E7574|nr:cold-shock protein [Paenibacillus sp. J2TS4]GIP32586.1 hypothetical protein J2TS4_17960 [Paenibacillus sp. J2TS4]